MIKQVSDQGWQQLEAHLSNFLGQALRSDVQQIEYKPRFFIHLLEVPSEHDRSEIREMNK